MEGQDVSRWVNSDSNQYPESQDWDKAEHIADPDATKPEDWDDEMDGEWEPPMIDNPEYKGEWKPRYVHHNFQFIEQSMKNLPRYTVAYSYTY